MLPIPASSDRAAETEFGQLIQVAPLLLFIIPSTAMVTRDIWVSTDSPAEAKELKTDAKSSNVIANSLVVLLIIEGLVNQRMRILI